LQTLVCFTLSGGSPVPATASAVEIVFAKPTSALSPSTALTLAMPAPGNDWMLKPGTAFSQMSLS
jgi:hypothetical protein